MLVLIILSFLLSQKQSGTYQKIDSFELAIAVGVFGLNPGQSFADVAGLLIEALASIPLVNFTFWFRKKLYFPSNQ